MVGATKRRTVAALLGAAILGAAPTVGACINGTYASTSQAVFLLRRAQNMLDAGDYLEGRRVAAIALEHAGDATERERAQWVLAMSHVRDESASRDDLVRAVETMRRIKATRTQTDVPSAVDLAEALARLPEGEDEARRLMMPLVRKDLVGSAHAYAALARIAEDEPMRTLAQTRCTMMAEDSALCTRGYTTSLATRDRWGARFLAAALATAGALGSVAVVLTCARLRRRAVHMAAFTMLDARVET